MIKKCENLECEEEYDMDPCLTSFNRFLPVCIACGLLIGYIDID